jgi:hypothetical protein
MPVFIGSIMVVLIAVILVVVTHSPSRSLAKSPPRSRVIINIADVNSVSDDINITTTMAGLRTRMCHTFKQLAHMVPDY